MLSKNKIKFLASLSDKKVRMETSSFAVEGEKLVAELIASEFNTIEILYTPKQLDLVQKLKIKPGIELFEISENEASRISGFKTAPGIMAVASIPESFYLQEPELSGEWVIALDDVQDPGNLGTIIRTADWFGIGTIVCSRNTSDVLNPKVLQSTMGAVFRVKICYTDLSGWVSKMKNKHPDFPILAAVLNGENIYKTELPPQGILMMGNESKGLSKELIGLANGKISIPNFGKSGQSSESLNVAVATSIIVSEIKRRS